MFECKQCGKTFRNRAGLKGHVAAIHEGRASKGNFLADPTPERVGAYVKAHLEDARWTEAFAKVMNKGVEAEVAALEDEVANKMPRLKARKAESAGIQVVLARNGYDISGSLRNGDRFLIQGIGTPETKTLTLRPEQEIIWVK